MRVHIRALRRSNASRGAVVGGTSNHARASARSIATLHESALAALRHSPVVRLQRIAPRGVDVYVKCEAINPMMSMKDRLAVGLLEWAEHHGHLRPGQTVVDSFSGSAGVALAMACAEHGRKLVAVAGEESDPNWRRLLRFLGARVLIADDPKDVAQKVALGIGGFLPARFRAEANAWIHERRTGPEILDALGDRRLDYFIAPHGTGGMLRGVGKVLRDKSPSTKIVVVEQDSRPHANYEASFGPHYSWPDEIKKGFTTDFAPTPMAADLREKFVDDTITMSGSESMMVARALAQIEGIFTGISGGALAAGALKVARAAPVGSSVLAVLLDTSHFHMSTPLVDEVPEDMSEEELQLLADVQPAVGPRSADELRRVDGQA